MKNFFTKIPSFVWVFIFPLLIVGLIGAIIGIFYLLANFEGVASVIMLIVLAVVVKSFFKYGGEFDQSKSDPWKSLWIGLSVCFFALMRMAIDQPGNYIYNKPLEYFFCPENTTLSRYVSVTNPLPGRTDMTQNFECVTASGELSYTISVGKIIAVRFVEYVIVAYMIIGAFYVYYWLKPNLATKI